MGAWPPLGPVKSMDIRELLGPMTGDEPLEKNINSCLKYLRSTSGYRGKDKKEFDAIYHFLCLSIYSLENIRYPLF